MKLFFRKYGAGKPLIILHGLFGQSDNWNSLAKRYAENGLEVYAVDQRNHGLSPHSREWTYEAMAEDIKELIENENLEAPFLMGHSMGGKTLMFFEMMFSRIAEKIIVADISPRAYPPQHGEVLNALKSIDLGKIKSRKEAEAEMNQYGLDFGTKQFLLKNLYWKDEEAKQLAWRFNLEVISAQYANAGIRIPDGKSTVDALFVKGGNSPYIGKEDEEEIMVHFPNAEVVTIAGAGHWVHAEKPNEFFEETMKFLKR